MAGAWKIVLVAAIFLLAIFAWHTYESPRPSFFMLHIQVNNTTNMGNVTVNTNNYYVLGDYLNVSVLQNAMAIIQWHDYYVTNAGYPTYNSSRVLQSISVFMANNRTVIVSVLPEA